MNGAANATTTNIHTLADELHELTHQLLSWAIQIGQYKTKNAEKIDIIEWQQLERVFTGLTAAAAKVSGISAVIRLQVVEGSLDHIKDVTTSMQTAWLV